MSATLSLSCSRKIYDLLGWYPTDSQWRKELYLTDEEKTDLEMKDSQGFEEFVESADAPVTLCTPVCANGDCCNHYGWGFPAPDFAETVRLLPKIAEKKGWKDYVNRSEECGQGMWDTLEDMTCLFVEAQSEEEGIAKVSEYLEKIL